MEHGIKHLLTQNNQLNKVRNAQYYSRNKRLILVYSIIRASRKTVQTCLALWFSPLNTDWHTQFHNNSTNICGRLTKVEKKNNNKNKNIYKRVNQTHAFITRNGKSTSHCQSLPFISVFFVFTFNLKWMGCGRKRRIEKAERPGGGAAYWFPSCCSIWALL